MDQKIDRILGTYSSGKKGPLLFLSGGIHGNEPSGVEAILKVFNQLKKDKPQIAGTVVGVSGNKIALNKGTRYIEEDLNRSWTEENIRLKKKNSSEQKQMFEIIDVLQKYPAEAFTKRYFLDCHTTSSASLPYISVQVVNENDEWAHRFPPYIIRGFSDIVYGCIDHYLSRIGVTGFVFEGGRHDSPHAVENHEGMIWIALEKACDLDLKSLSEMPKSIGKINNSQKDQKTFEIVHRFGLEDGDTFSMEPGYENFQKIKKGELLAICNNKEIRSSWDARIFMPLYQDQGNDGFFVIKEVES
ncbi:succinylglutamate desuccinylase/aspartoacylase family protein [Flavimarina sp. Hel_I_48]|uniref:succinylglutamate desuccinylase/aspartoacylase domain-containing protein n=1 Tax=Flavimarina sp. Hel_I_48 TaxID=1392488 RepID=UPI0004DF9521|nr:succinylglutamate desuccinylase/aspartoacylase family protein [Flavimarina sp. Hel_I_48]